MGSKRPQHLPVLPWGLGGLEAESRVEAVSCHTPHSPLPPPQQWEIHSDGCHSLSPKSCEGPGTTCKWSLY